METQNLGAAFPLTPEPPSLPVKVSRATWAGLAISLFALVAIRQAFVFFVPETTFASAILKEALIWLNAVALIVIIRRGERLPLRSIGLGTARWWKSILWGFIIAVVSAVAVGRAGSSHRLRTRPRLCRVRETAAVVNHRDRYSRRSRRRIILSRLRDRTLADDWSGRFWSVAIPLVIFSLGHWSGGAANILIAFAAGSILTGFYLWRRDLVANMIGHGLVDFVATSCRNCFPDALRHNSFNPTDSSRRFPAVFSTYMYNHRGGHILVA